VHQKKGGSVPLYGPSGQYSYGVFAPTARRGHFLRWMHREREVAAMTLPKRSWGLCMTCNSSSTCTRRKGMKLPVLFCEEFDGWTPLDVKNEPTPFTEDEQITPDAAMGLCCNCENRGSCTLRDSPGGVWHCEEYR